MSLEAGPRRAGPVALAVTLTVPPPWSEAVGAVGVQLGAEFDLGPLSPFEPHVSLCRPFCCAASPGVVAPVVEVALQQALAPVCVGNVGSFQLSDGSPEVIYLAVQAPWLGPLNRRLVQETEPYRCGADALLAVSGNPEYDLDDYTPHVTIVIARGHADRVARHQALIERAAELWSERRPAGEGFAVEEIVLSVLDADGADWPPPQAAPRTVRAWRFGGGDPTRLQLAD